MAKKLILKHSTFPSDAPLPADLSIGELAVNTEDKKLFTKDSGGSIVELSTDASTINGASIDSLQREVFTTTNSSNSVDDYVKIAVITLDSLYAYSLVNLTVYTTRVAHRPHYIEIYTKQNSAFPALPWVRLNHSSSGGSTYDFGYTSSSDGSTSTVTIYLKYNSDWDTGLGILNNIKSTSSVIVDFKTGSALEPEPVGFNLTPKDVIYTSESLTKTVVDGLNIDASTLNGLTSGDFATTAEVDTKTTITSSTSSPSSPVNDELWLDLTTNTLYIWNVSLNQWILLSGANTVNDDAPNDDRFYVRHNGFWVEIAQAMLGPAPTEADKYLVRHNGAWVDISQAVIG